LIVFPPVPLLPRLQAINVAIVTDAIMTAQRCSASHTPPLRILTLDKSGKRMLLDKG
jgi:ribulose bisphosphate carboxylase small subunit